MRPRLYFEVGNKGFVVVFVSKNVQHFAIAMHYQWNLTGQSQLAFVLRCASLAADKGIDSMVFFV
jgi:hypothetical protein